MNKILAMFFIFFLSFVDAKEPFLAMLKEVYTNDLQTFGYKESSFVCKPYGVLTLEELYEQSGSTPACKRAIDEFYIQHPSLKYLAEIKLHKGQLYHILFRKEECIIYLKGQMSYSELLLQKGVAMKNRDFNDKEFRSVFYDAQESARIEKKGLWGSDIFGKCASER
jgi:hypothetical protein